MFCVDSQSCMSSWMCLSSDGVKQECNTARRNCIPTVSDEVKRPPSGVRRQIEVPNR